MYKCPICKHNRNNKLHTDKCSRIAKETLEEITTAPKTDYSEIPAWETRKRIRTNNGFY
jgi:hypothetical protein